MLINRFRGIYTRHAGTYLVLLSAAYTSFSGCIGSKYGSKGRRHEITAIKVETGRIIDNKKLKEQLEHREGDRAAFFDPTAYGTTAVSMLATGIKTAIDREQKKYEAQYEFIIEPTHNHKIADDSLYFYRSTSDKGWFDPTGIKFRGFTIERYFGNNRELAMKASFELDTCNLTEIFYDGIFRLKLKEIEVYYAKAKMGRRRKKINLDISVQVSSSFFTQQGQLFNNIQLGSFQATVANLEVGNKESWTNYSNRQMNGYCFIIPRSYGHTLDGADKWNEGMFALHVTVRETSRHKYLNKTTVNTAGKFIDATQSALDIKKLMKNGQGNKSK